MLDRGSIAVGMPADILVYDLKALRLLPEEVLYDQPGGEWRRAKKAATCLPVPQGRACSIGPVCRPPRR